jgi:Ala-tRNA(Pro) deacylase
MEQIAQKHPAAGAAGADLPTSPEAVLALFSQLGIDFKLHHHPPVFTVAEGEDIQRHIPGAHCRNLFLRDKKERMALVMLRNETEVDLKKLPPLIGLDRVSFGSPERLWQFLGVKPGSVCPFAVVNDTGKQVKAVVDHSLMACDLVNFHPLVNTMTVGMHPGALIRFLEHTQHLPHIVDLTAVAPAGER